MPICSLSWIGAKVNEWCWWVAFGVPILLSVHLWDRHRTSNCCHILWLTKPIGGINASVDPPLNFYFYKRTLFIPVLVPWCNRNWMNVQVNAFYAILVDKYCTIVFFRDFLFHSSIFLICTLLLSSWLATLALLLILVVRLNISRYF